MDYINAFGLQIFSVEVLAGTSHPGLLHYQDISTLKKIAFMNHPRGGIDA